MRGVIDLLYLWVSKSKHAEPMKTLVLCSFVLFAACNTAPDGVIVDGDEARVAVFAVLDLSGDIAKWRPESPKLEAHKWLYDNNFEFSYFEPDTTLGKMGENERGPIYIGFSIYRK